MANDKAIPDVKKGMTEGATGGKNIVSKAIGLIPTPLLIGCSILPALLAVIIVVFALLFMKVASEANIYGNRPGLFGDVGGGGGYIIDSAFTKIPTLSADEALNKLSGYSNLKNKKTQVEMIIQKGSAAGINWWILLDIWGAEQTFGNDSAAMGCGVWGGQNRFPGFEPQLDCAIEKIKEATNNQGPYYDKPTGENIFTRLFYNYTGSMKARYHARGYVAECNDNRLKFHRFYDASEVVCEAGGLGPGVALVGEKLYPPLGDKQNHGETYHAHSCWETGEDTGCAVDYSASGGTPLYAVADGTVTNLHRYTSEGGQYRGYTFYFDSDDGQVWAVYAHLDPAGGLSPNDIQRTVAGIKKGQTLGKVYGGLNDPHLHFQLKINGKTIGIPYVGGRNYQLDYFGNIQ